MDTSTTVKRLRALRSSADRIANLAALSEEEWQRLIERRAAGPIEGGPRVAVDVSG
jgi:hypothetical protein